METIMIHIIANAKDLCLKHSKGNFVTVDYCDRTFGLLKY